MTCDIRSRWSNDMAKTRTNFGKKDTKQNLFAISHAIYPLLKPEANSTVARNWGLGRQQQAKLSTIIYAILDWKRTRNKNRRKIRIETLAPCRKDRVMAKIGLAPSMESNDSIRSDGSMQNHRKNSVLRNSANASYFSFTVKEIFKWTATRIESFTIPSTGQRQIRNSFLLKSTPLHVPPFSSTNNNSFPASPIDYSAYAIDWFGRRRRRRRKAGEI